MKAVLFDMDGVITNTMEFHVSAWCHAAKDVLAVEMDPLDIYLREGQPAHRFFEEMAGKYGFSVTEDEEKALIRLKEEHFKSIVQERYVEGSLDFVARIKREGVACALVTGTARHELDAMLPAAIKELFDVIVTSSDVLHGKPSPEPFLRAAEHIGVHVSDCFVVENAPLGIRAAKEAKMFCVALTTSLPAEYLKAADVVAEHFDDVSYVFDQNKRRS